jgi:hypothetical protein
VRVVMQDGRVFEGTAVQIVQAMKDIAFGSAEMSLADYIDWVAREGMGLDGAEISGVAGGNMVMVDEKAKSLIEVMLRHGFARAG